MTDSGPTKETMEEDHSPEIKLEGINGGHEGYSIKSTTKKNKMDRGSGMEEEDENITNSSRSLCPFSGSFPVIPALSRRTESCTSNFASYSPQEGCSKGQCIEVYFKKDVALHSSIIPSLAVWLHPVRDLLSLLRGNSQGED